MKKNLLIAVLASILFVSCATPKYIEVRCELDDTELFNQISTTLVQNGYRITHTDYKAGVLSAEQEDSSIWTGSQSFYWSFVRKNGYLIATAKMKTTATVNLDDKTHSSWTQYWNVRNELENICKNKIIFKEVGT